MKGSNSIVTIGALEVFQKNIDAYGKQASANQVTLSENGSIATVTAISTGVKPKSGDLIYVYPFLASTEAVVSPIIGNNIKINVQYLKNGVGFTEVPISATNATSLDEMRIAINTAFDGAGIGDYIVATIQDTTRLRIQAKALNVTFNVDSASTWDCKIPKATPAYLGILTIKDDYDSGTSIPVSVRYLGKTTLTAADRTNLEYVVFRNIGEMTGATLNSSLDPVIYKGLSKVAKQIEYAEGTASLTCDEMAFNRDNLSYIYGWTKQTSAQFQSGKTSAGTTKYSFTEDTIPQTVGLFGLHKKIDGGLIIFLADSSKTNNLDLSMKKTEFRTSSVEFNLLTPTSKCVWSLVSV